MTSISAINTKAQFTNDPLKLYIVQNSCRLTPIQEGLIDATMKQKMNRMLGSPEELQFLANLCKVINAKKTLDIGVYTGYSALTIAMVLPSGGKVIACDVSDEFPNVGKPFWKAAGVCDKIDLRIAPALETLEKLVKNGECDTFDFAFLDADKFEYRQYYEYCLKLVRKGGIIAIDNTLWSGTVVNAEKGLYNKDSEDFEKAAICLNDLNKFLHHDDRIDISFLQLGDGTTLCFKK